MEAAAQLLDACLKGNLDKWCVTWQHRGERTGGNRLPRSRTANQQHAAEKRIDRAEDECRLRVLRSNDRRERVSGVLGLCDSLRSFREVHWLHQFLHSTRASPLVPVGNRQRQRTPSRLASFGPPPRVTKSGSLPAARRLARGVAVGAFEETETVTRVAPSPHLQVPDTMTNGVRGVSVVPSTPNVDGSDWSRLVKLAFTPRGGHSAHRSGLGAGGHR